MGCLRCWLLDSWLSQYWQLTQSCVVAHSWVSIHSQQAQGWLRIQQRKIFSSETNNWFLLSHIKNLSVTFYILSAFPPNFPHSRLPFLTHSLLSPLIYHPSSSETFSFFFPPQLCPDTTEIQFTGRQ